MRRLELGKRGRRKKGENRSEFGDQFGARYAMMRGSCSPSEKIGNRNTSHQASLPDDPVANRVGGEMRGTAKQSDQNPLCRQVGVNSLADEQSR